MDAQLLNLQEQVRAAAADGRAIRLRGSGSKDFYGQTLTGDLLDTRGYAGVVAYEPTELVITARCGTRLAEIESLLAERGQMLAFEPPHFGPDATVGGCVSAGLSGPRRPAVGSVRDFVLGVKLIDGHAEVMAFGGQVMKNVAGYDVSRLVCGALGTLGLIAEVSLKVLPLPFEESTLLFRMSDDAGAGKAQRVGRSAAADSASAYYDGALGLRLSGAGAAVRAARQRPRRRSRSKRNRRRLSGRGCASRPIRSSTATSRCGGCRCRRSPARSTCPAGNWSSGAVPCAGSSRTLRRSRFARRAMQAGGHATLFRATDRSATVFQPLSATLQAIHRRLKQALDPQGIFNPGRMYVNL